MPQATIFIYRIFRLTMRLTVFKDWESCSGDKETVEVIRELYSGLPFLLTDATDKTAVLYFGKQFEVKHKDGRISRV